ncbi:hypothetical protein SynA1528_00231 [Synechococcus sp. A15-28]|nr:hypothetical protein SynA1528_00231 [Synechococcus sp. A15-28]
MAADETSPTGDQDPACHGAWGARCLIVEQVRAGTGVCT